MKHPRPEHLLYLLLIFTSSSLRDSMMESVSSIFLPPKYQHTDEIRLIGANLAFYLCQAPANFLHMYFNTLCSVVARTRGNCYRLQYLQCLLNTSVSAMISCSRAKKEVTWSRHGAAHPVITMQTVGHATSGQQTPHFFNFFDHATTWYLLYRKY